MLILLVLSAVFISIMPLSYFETLSSTSFLNFDLFNFLNPTVPNKREQNASRILQEAQYHKVTEGEVVKYHLDM